MIIDKNKLEPEERAEFERLIAKGMVDPEAAKKEMEDQEPTVPPKKKPTEKAEVETVETKKSEAPATPEVPDFVKNAIAKSEEFFTKAEKKEQLEVAKKYAVLVESVDDLAEQLYNLKKSDTAMYDTCIAMMDKQAALIEKSGLFSEIGKSGGAGSKSGGSADAMAEARAQEIMKADTSIDYDTAIAKAYMDPDIMAAYDAEYYKR